MNVSSSTTVQAATAAAQASPSDEVNMLVLKKAINQEASSVTQLLQALPQPPLATQGSVGTKVNTFA